MNHDPWGSLQNFMSSFKQFAANPAQYMVNHCGIPQNIANDPNAIIQHMMSSGKLSQQNYNAARNAAMKIQNNPMFNQLLK